MMKKILLLTITLLIVAVQAWAQTKFEKEGIYYKERNETEVEVTFEATESYTGDLIIPASVINNGTTYTVTGIGQYAFYDCLQLTSVAIPASVKNISTVAFENATAITNITVDDQNSTYSSVDGVLFNKDQNTLVYYPARKSPSGSYDIPSGVTTIEENAFAYNYLSSVKLPDGLLSIGEWAFHQAQITSISIPASVTYIGDYVFFGCYKLTEITVIAANTNYCSDGGVLFDKDKTTLISYPMNKTDESYTVPSSVVTIKERALYNQFNLTSVILPAGLTTIESQAFYDCNKLASVTVLNPSPVNISDNTFTSYAALSFIIPSPYVANYKEENVWKDFTIVPGYQVSAVSADINLGSVDGIDDLYASGAEVTFTATANDGYKFANWTVKGVRVSTNPIYTFNVTKDMELVANFTSNSYNEPTYHTVALTVEDGIQCNYTAGDLSITEGEHLYLTFYPDDATLTADDILFMIDGKEATFNVSTDNRSGSYILNPVTSDYTVLIALREYETSFPEIDGLTITAAEKVVYGKPFTFTLSSETLDLSEMVVYANGTELIANALRTDSYTYTIDRVTGPINITVEGVNPTDNIDLASGHINISTRNGQLTIDNSTGSPIDVAVFTIVGKNVVSLRGVSGSRSIMLPSGIYVVKAGNTTTKIIIH